MWPTDAIRGAAGGTPPADAPLGAAVPEALWGSPLGVAIVGRDARFVRVNEALARLNGAPSDGHVGHTAAEIVAQGGPLITEMHRRALLTGQPATNVEVTTSAWGELRHSLRTFIPLRLGADVAGVYVVATDITERKRLQARMATERDRAERAAARLERLRTIALQLGASPSVEGTAELVVREGLELTGACAAAVHVVAPGSVLRLVFGAGMTDETIVRARQVGLWDDVPVAVVARTGERMWLDSRAAIAHRFPALVPCATAANDCGWAVLPLQSGQRVLGTLALAFPAPFVPEADERDVVVALAAECAQAVDRARLARATEEELEAIREGERDRERLVAELRTALRARDESAATLDAFFDAAPIGLALVDRDLAFRRVNPALAAMDGLPASAHVGRRPDQALPGFPGEEIVSWWRRVLDRGVAVLDRDLGGTCWTGRRRHWRMCSVPVRVAGEVVAAGCIVRDVTPEKEAEEFQRHVLGIVGHDLRTPLSAVVMAAQVLRARAPLGPSDRSLLDRIETSSATARRIVGDLLDMTLARAGQGFPIVTRSCDIAEVLDDVAAEALASRPDRAIETEGTGDPTGWWDPDRLAQAVGNVVSNALSHTRAGAPVWVRWRGDHAAVVVQVHNEGTPIAPELLPHIFEPFRRAEARLGRGGAGLGLFIAREIVRAHGGTIEVDSTRERGTTFTIALPRRPPGR